MLRLLSGNCGDISRYIIKSSAVKNQHYWLNIEKIMKLLMTFIYLNNSTIDINQRLISEELFENKTFDKIFFMLKISGQRIKVEVTPTVPSVLGKDVPNTMTRQQSNKTSLVDI